MVVFFVNETTVLTDREAWNVAWVCDFQARFHLPEAGWRGDVRCSFLPGGGHAVIPTGGAVMHLLDTCDQPGALGYHDEDGRAVPFGRVGVKTARANGQSESEVASHETCELAGDPNVNLAAPDGGLRRLYALELCDAVQGAAYTISGLRGLPVADFVLPSYFDPRTPAGEYTSFRRTVRGPFSLAPNGYQSFVDLTNVKAGWQQKLGGRLAEAPADPDDRSRLRRRGVVPVR